MQVALSRSSFVFLLFFFQFLLPPESFTRCHWSESVSGFKSGADVALRDTSASLSAHEGVLRRSPGKPSRECLERTHGFQEGEMKVLLFIIPGSLVRVLLAEVALGQTCHTLLMAAIAQYVGLLKPWVLPGRIGAGCHFFLPGIFPARTSRASCIAGFFTTESSEWALPESPLHSLQAMASFLKKTVFSIFLRDL